MDLEEALLALERDKLMSHLKRSGVAGKAVLEAMANVPRNLFVEQEFLLYAWVNRPLPISAGQTISQPTIVAMMTEAALNGRNQVQRVLEIGTGSGYQAAVLAQVAKEVYSIERIESLKESAMDHLAQAGIGNVAIRLGDGHDGWPEKAPYDGIVITAAADGIPPALIEQLADNGRLVAPLNTGLEGQELVVVDKTPDGPIQRTIEYVRFVPLLRGIEKITS